MLVQPGTRMSPNSRLPTKYRPMTKLNTAITALMVLTNHLMGLEHVPRLAAETLVLLVSPFAPHLGEELWRATGHTESLAYEPWPAHDEAWCAEDTVEIGVQVNGRTRGTVTIARQASEADARAAAAAIPSVARHLEGKQVVKFVYVRERIINFVVR